MFDPHPGILFSNARGAVAKAINGSSEWINETTLKGLASTELGDSNACLASKAVDAAICDEFGNIGAGILIRARIERDSSWLTFDYRLNSFNS